MISPEVKLAKTSPAPTATAQGQKKTCKIADFYGGDWRSILVMAVGKFALRAMTHGDTDRTISP
jgi:hypothetical protein